MRRATLGPLACLAALTFAGSGIDNATAAPASLVFSTYFGGSSTDVASAVAVDSSGNTYVTGWTASTDLPVKNAIQYSSGGGVDAFVAKFDPTGALVYCTYLGGAGDDRAFAIAVDSTGAVYLTGWTASTDFPTAGASHQQSLAGGSNAFVAKLSATGGLIYSTYLGGSSSDQGRAIALDASGNAFIAGQTTSSNFPTLNPLQAALKGPQDAFVAEVNGLGALLFSTYLGGSGTDTAAAIAVGGDGSLYLTGATDSVDFPTLNALQPVNGGYQDAFVTKLSPKGAAIVFSTYLGGSGGSVDYPEAGLAIDVDPNNNAYIAGVTSSPNFPTRNAFQPALAGWVDAFVAKVDATGTVLDFSTYLGGSNLDYGVALRVDSSGAACVAGYSTSPGFPLANPVQSGLAGLYDAFVSCLAASGQALIFSTLLGGSNSDAAYGLAMNAGFLYVAGMTASSDFPLKNPFRSLNTSGKISAFVTKLTRSSGAITYLVGDVAPFTADTAPAFGDGILNILDLIQELFAVNNVPGFRPAACSDRFDAMDLYPADTATTRGGDGVLDIRDLNLELFRVNNLDLARPVRTSLGGVCPGAPSQSSARTTEAGRSAGLFPRPPAAVQGALALGNPETSSEAEERVPVYLKAGSDLARVAVTFALGDQRSRLRFVTTAETPPSLMQDSQPGVVAAAWLEGVSIRAGEWLLLGYVAGPPGALANLKVYGVSASGLDDNREVRLEAPGTGGVRVNRSNGSGCKRKRQRKSKT